MANFIPLFLTPTGFTHRPDDWGNKHLWNVGKLLPDYTARRPKRRSSLWFSLFLVLLRWRTKCWQNSKGGNEVFKEFRGIHQTDKIKTKLQGRKWVVTNRRNDRLQRRTFNAVQRAYNTCFSLQTKRYRDIGRSFSKWLWSGNKLKPNPLRSDKITVPYVGDFCQV
jgi:hypothetical protein